MGRKQRHSDLVGLTDEEVERAAKDRSLDSRTRRKFQQEAKFRRRRNRQKRKD